MEASDRTLLDQLAVSDLIHRERMARDNGLWDEMASYYHPESTIEVSWFRGSGAEFIARSRKNVRPDGVSLHVLSPSVVRVSGDRAIAETPCTLRGFMRHDGVDSSVESFVRLLSRAERVEGRWLIAGLRCLYVRDRLMACTPTRPPMLDDAMLSRYRLSYRYLSYHLAKLGLSPANDLPGVDRPETVTALRASEHEWLRASVTS
ncbi:Bile acid 7-alpha dehydratase BaiE [Minicystis rosea]|nr:Bile acid 7-alpha dehydratase BaiE [Minicystis rosea]